MWAPGRKIDPATAAAVEGPWQPFAVNTSGTWDLNDLIAEHLYRWDDTPPAPTRHPTRQEGDAMAAPRRRSTRY